MVLMRDKLKMDGVLILHRVYTHSKDVDTWRRTCSVVSQLTNYLNLPAAWTAIKKKIRQWEKNSVSLQTGHREGFDIVKGECHR